MPAIRPGKGEGSVRMSEHSEVTGPLMKALAKLGNYLSPSEVE